VGKAFIQSAPNLFSQNNHKMQNLRALTFKSSSSSSCNMLQTATHKKYISEDFRCFRSKKSLRWYLSCHVVVVMEHSKKARLWNLNYCRDETVETIAFFWLARLNTRKWFTLKNARPSIWHFMLAMLWNKENAFFLVWEVFWALAR
jgi:hypothetical protein